MRTPEGSGSVDWSVFASKIDMEIVLADSESLPNRNVLLEAGFVSPKLWPLLDVDRSVQPGRLRSSSP